MGCRHTGFHSCCTWVQQLWPMGLVTSRHVGSCRIRDQTHVSCLGRQILYHWATREALNALLTYNIFDLWWVSRTSSHFKVEKGMDSVICEMICSKIFRVTLFIIATDGKHLAAGDCFNNLRYIFTKEHADYFFKLYRPKMNIFKDTLLRKKYKEFPGGPVVRTWCFYCCGLVWELRSW